MPPPVKTLDYLMRLLKALLLTPALLCLSSCSQYNSLIKKARAIGGEDEVYEATPGEEATKFFAKTNNELETNIEAINESLSLSKNEKAKLNLFNQGLLNLVDLDQVAEVSDAASQTLRKIRQAKKLHKPDTYVQDDPSLLNPEASALALIYGDLSYLRSDQVSLESTFKDFTISILNKMPVRDQGGRGTCASFAAIGQIEGLILKKYSSLKNIDLSEQRFYYMSKPANWANGGDVNKGGSDPGTGFAKSFPTAISAEPEGIWTTGATSKKPEDSPTGSQAYNLPLETECPYVANKTGNDLQTPQIQGCKGTGVARVDDFVAWMYKQTSRPLTAQQLYNQLVATDAPVIVMTKLSSNWESNDGMVTKADADAAGEGASSHSGGHAYLIVGARQLKEAEFPGEGGMCFVIKNSWGKGWGIDGYSCMTLAWFNEWRFESAFPQATSVSLNTAKFSEITAKDIIKPDKIAEPDDQTKILPDRMVKQRGSLSFLVDGAASGFALADFSLASLLNNQDQYTKILYKIDSNVFYLRGILNGEEKQTHEIRFDYENGILSSHFNAKGSIELGKWDETKKILTLCSQEYSEVCHFNYHAASNELVVGYTEEEFLREDSEGPFTWRSLNLVVKNLEVSFPQFLPTKIDARFNKDSGKTNPLRFNIEPLSGAIIFQNKKVGNYFSGAFCSGDYVKVCRLVKTADQFLVLFRPESK